MANHAVLGVVAAVLAATATPAFAQHRHGEPAGAPSHGAHAHGAQAHGSTTGVPGDPKKPARVVRLKLGEDGTNMVFVPDRVELKRGEQVRFVLANEGELEHEFFLGTAAEIGAHAEEMKAMPEMKHVGTNAKTLAPKTGGDLLWRFNKRGEFAFACLIPGHLEAGMKGTIVVK